mmetsp:Transcript_42874/g.89558  ORF Transcript_42874/g.89558 Transcript_42874/m.89558 type:complete len:183 (-) Transcript_42874:643-1191(-)
MAAAAAALQDWGRQAARAADTAAAAAGAVAVAAASKAADEGDAVEPEDSYLSNASESEGDDELEPFSKIQLDFEVGEDGKVVPLIGVLGPDEADARRDDIDLAPEMSATAEIEKVGVVLQVSDTGKVQMAMNPVAVTKAGAAGEEEDNFVATLWRKVSNAVGSFIEGLSSPRGQPEEEPKTY